MKASYKHISTHNTNTFTFRNIQNTITGTIPPIYPNIEIVSNQGFLTIVPQIRNAFYYYMMFKDC